MVAPVDVSRRPLPRRRPGLSRIWAWKIVPVLPPFLHCNLVVMNEIYWGGAVSLEGRIQALEEAVALQRSRAEKAERIINNIKANTSRIDAHLGAEADLARKFDAAIAAAIDEET